MSKHAYLDELELADPHGAPLAPQRGFAAVAAPPMVFTADAQQAVTAGSSLVEFDASVDPDLKKAITNALLLAQLAANKAAGSGTIETWYKKYTEVLGHIGWITGAMSFHVEKFEGDGMEVHKAIAKVLAATLVPGAAAVSITLAVLGGLESMAADAPWLTIFDRASRHTHFNSFQMSYASLEGGTPMLKLLCFAVDTNATTTQILFFKFSDAGTRLRQYTGEVRANVDVLLQTRDKIASLVAADADDYLSNLSL